MTSIKCVHCGLVNWAIAPACKRCGNPPQDGSPQEEFAGWAAPQQEAGGWSAPGRTYHDADVKKRKGLATASLVLGIISIFTLTLFVVGAVTGLVLGIVALSRVKNQPALYGGRGLAVAGIVTSALSFVLVVPLGIIAAIAIPNLVAARRAANEASAISSIRQIALAEATYSATAGAGEYGDIDQLASVNLIEGGVARGINDGYYFRVLTYSGGCEISAVPKDYRTTGVRSFYATCEDAEEVRGADKGGEPASAEDPVVGGSQNPNRRVIKLRRAADGSYVRSDD